MKKGYIKDHYSFFATGDKQHALAVRAILQAPCTYVVLATLLHDKEKKS